MSSPCSNLTTKRLISRMPRLIPTHRHWSLKSSVIDVRPLPNLSWQKIQRPKGIPSIWETRGRIAKQTNIRMITFRGGAKCQSHPCPSDPAATILQVKLTTGSRSMSRVSMSGNQTNMLFKSKWIHLNRFNSIMLISSMREIQEIMAWSIIILQEVW